MWDLIAKVDFIIIGYTSPSDTMTENFMLLLSFLIKDFYAAETRLKLYNLHCLGIFSGLQRNTR